MLIGARTAAWDIPYRRVSAIRNKGYANWIDLGVKYSTDMSIDFTYKRISCPVEGSIVLATGSTQPLLFAPAQHYSDKLDRIIWRRSGYTEQHFYNYFSSYPETGHVFIDAVNDKLYFNGTNVLSGMLAGMGGKATPYSSNGNIALFSINGNYACDASVGDVTILKSGSLYRKYLAVENLDGNGAMYEICQKKLYTRANTSYPIECITD